MLKIVDSAPGNAQRAQAETLPNPAQSRSTVIMATCSRAWQTVTNAQRAGFEMLARSWSPTPGRPTNGFRVFQSLNINRMNMGTAGILTDCPQKPDPIVELPPLTVDATVTPEGSFSLTVTASTAYGGLVDIRASRPLSTGRTRLRRNDVKAITQAATLPAAPLDVAEGYLNAYKNAPHLGMQVMVTLCPCTPNGFRGITIAIPVVVQAPDSLTLSDAAPAPQS